MNSFTCTRPSPRFAARHAEAATAETTTAVHFARVFPLTAGSHPLGEVHRPDWLFRPIRLFVGRSDAWLDGPGKSFRSRLSGGGPGGREPPDRPESPSTAPDRREPSRARAGLFACPPAPLARSARRGRIVLRVGEANGMSTESSSLRIQELLAHAAWV